MCSLVYTLVYPVIEIVPSCEKSKRASWAGITRLSDGMHSSSLEWCTLELLILLDQSVA